MRETLILVCFILATGLYFYYSSADEDPNRATYKVPESVKVADEQYKEKRAKAEAQSYTNQPYQPDPNYSSRVLQNYSDEGPQFSSEFPPSPEMLENEMPDIQAPPEDMSAPLSKTYMLGESVDRFIITINDQSYDQRQQVFTQTPIYGWFLHPDPRVTHVRMEYPENTSLFVNYPVNEKVRIQIHESHLQAGIKAYSDFIAQDTQGNEYSRIRLTFVP